MTDQLSLLDQPIANTPTAPAPAAPPAPSPFLPGTRVQFAWDSTCLGLLKTCPRLYQYSILEGWSGNEESVHLRFGIEFHRALQDYDLSRCADIPHDDAVHDVVRELVTRTANWEPDHKYKNKPNLLRTIVWYLDHFKDDPAQTYVKADGKPAVELSFKFELDWGPKAGYDHPINGSDKDIPYLLCGHLDRVVRFNDELFVMDHKTTTSTPGEYFFNQFEPNNQMTLYTLASQIVLLSPIRGVIIDAAQIGVDFSRFTRGLTYRTQAQIDEWVHDLRYWLTLAEEYAKVGYWPQNDTACDKFGGCKFRSICSKSPQVREKFLEGNFKKQTEEERWNPLKPR